MTSDELVEKVARALCKSQGEMEAAWVFYRKDARTAIRIALEEAAKVAERSPDSHWGPTIAREIRAIMPGNND